MAAKSLASGEVTEERVWKWLEAVPDPEIPVLTIIDLGMIRGVLVTGDSVEVAVSPTYTGCPATEVIEHSILAELKKRGVVNASVKRVLSPAWSTDWISEQGREKLRDYGIAPPAAGSKAVLLGGLKAVPCPRCSSTRTTLVSEFGSTACKSSHKCDDCLEPFEHFKCI